MSTIPLSISDLVMPYCPQCRAEYLDSVTTCPECRVGLSAELPAPDGKAAIQLVQVYLAHGEIDAQMIRSLLEASGVECMLSGESVRITHGLTLDGLAEVKILVREEDRQRAREVISASEHLCDCPQCGEPNLVETASCRYCKQPLELSDP